MDYVTLIDWSPLASFLKFYFTSMEYFFILYLLVANSSYAVLLIFGYINSRREFTRSLVKLPFKKSVTNILRPISLLVPAYNEEKTVVESVSSLLRLSYPNFEIVVVNDGSKDHTLDVLIKKFDLHKVDLKYPQALTTAQVRSIYLCHDHKNLIVIDKENGGKADALNAAINHSKFPLICCIDSDSILDEEGLIQIAMPFFEDPEKMIAVGGTIRVANNTLIENGRVKETRIKWGYMDMIQIVEYLRAFLVGRMGWDYIKCNTIISGAFGLFLKEAVLKVGGYGRNTIGEDLELLLRIQAAFLKEGRPYRVKFLPDPICWTEVPFDLKTLGNQRSRWMQGLAESLWATRGMLFKEWSGRIGNFALPYLLFFELISAPLEIFSYLMTLLGVVFKLVDPNLALLFLLLSVVYGWILTFGAIVIEEMTFQKYKNVSDYTKLFMGSILEQFGFRQIHLYWRLRGLWRFFRGTGTWGQMKRRGFSKNS